MKNYNFTILVLLEKHISEGLNKTNQSREREKEGNGLIKTRKAMEVEKERG